METAIKKRLSSRSASYVQSELFFCIRSLSGQINCPVLNRIVNTKIYARSKRMAKGLAGEKVSNFIDGVDMNTRHRIVKLISDNMKGKSPFKMNLDQYIALSELLGFYDSLLGKQHLLESEENKIQQRVKEVFPNLRNPQPINL